MPCACVHGSRRWCLRERAFAWRGGGGGGGGGGSDAGRGGGVAGRVVGARVVRLERRSGGRWARLGRGRRFPLLWRAPRAAGVARLRVVAVRRGRAVAATPSRRVAVSATRVLAASRIEASGT